jgi:signal transduction histidine kinase
MSDVKSAMTDSRWQRALQDLEGEFTRVTEALNAILEMDRRFLELAPKLDDLLAEMLKGICHLTGAQHAQILLLQRNNTLEIVHSTQKQDLGRQFKLNECVCGEAVDKNKSVISGDVQRDFADLYQPLLLNGAKPMRSEMAIPIRSPASSSTVLGVLNVEWPKKNAIRGVRSEIVEQFALQVGSAIHSLKSRQALQLAMDLVQLIHSTSHREAIRQTLQKLSLSFDPDVVIQFLLLDHDALVIQASTVKETESVRVLVANSFSGMAVEREQAVRSGNVWSEHADRFQNTVGDKSGERINSELAVPIIDEGKVIGVVNIESPRLNAFTEHDEYVLSTIAQAGAWYRFHDARLRRAVDTMAVIGDVSANMVHILNNYVMTVVGHCQELANLAPTDPSSLPLKEAIYRVVYDVDAIVERVSRLDKQYQRAMAGNIRIDIGMLVREVAAELVTRMLTNEIAVVFDIDPTMNPLSFPPAIKDVFWNLLSNANAAIEEGSRGTITIKMKVRRGDYTKQMEALELSFSDTGKGIDPAQRDAIFELGKGERHGYGLWWVKTFVERCRGSIQVESTVGSGTTFNMEFPLTAEGEAGTLVEN